MKTKASSKKSPKKRKQERLAKTMSGSDLLIHCLERQGVDTIFAYPGGASMQMHQSLTYSSSIRTILPRHEQGGSFMAAGYAQGHRKDRRLYGYFRPGSHQPDYRHCGLLSWIRFLWWPLPVR
jgi:hypothetical protein